MFMKWPAWLNRTVLGAGIASFFGDLGYESVTVLLPSFLIILGAPVFALGIIEGLSDGASSFVSSSRDILLTNWAKDGNLRWAARSRLPSFLRSSLLPHRGTSSLPGDFSAGSARGSAAPHGTRSSRNRWRKRISARPSGFTGPVTRSGRSRPGPGPRSRCIAGYPGDPFVGGHPRVHCVCCDLALPA